MASSSGHVTLLPFLDFFAGFSSKSSAADVTVSVDACDAEEKTNKHQSQCEFSEPKNVIGVGNDLPLFIAYMYFVNFGW